MCIGTANSRTLNITSTQQLKPKPLQKKRYKLETNYDDFYLAGQMERANVKSSNSSPQKGFGRSGGK